MASVVTKAQIVVLPVYRRHWVFACKAQEVLLEPGEPSSSERRGGVTAWLRQAAASARERVTNSLTRQWLKAEQAKKGTLLNYTYRFGQWALSQNHPDETFLQAVPPQAAQMELIFPESIRERFVRRRLRLLIQGRMEYHKIWAAIWGVITVPGLPLILSPLPNLPIYYSGYRTWAHYRAWQGAQSLMGVIVDIDRKQLLTLREKLLEMQEGGRQLEEGSWAAELTSLSPRYQSILCSGPCVGGQLTELADMPKKATFTKSKELEDIVKPATLWDEPVPDCRIAKAAEAFHFPTCDVLAHVAKARKLALKDQQQ